MRCWPNNEPATPAANQASALKEDLEAAFDAAVAGVERPLTSADSDASGLDITLASPPDKAVLEQPKAAAHSQQPRWPEHAAAAVLGKVSSSAQGLYTASAKGFALLEVLLV